MVSRFIQVTLFCLCFVAGFGAYAASDLYTIDNIAIEETAGNAAQAKKNAIEAGQLKAFSILAEMLNISPSNPDISKITSEEILKTVKSYEVKDEKIVKKSKYSGTLQVSFIPEMVQALLARENIPITFVSNKKSPTLIIPVFYNKGQRILWSDENIWLAAWDNSDLQSRIAPFILPVGDLEDLNIVSPESILKNDNTTWTELGKKYNADNIIIAEAEYLVNNTGAPQDLMVTLIHVGNPQQENETLSLNHDGTKSEYEYLQRTARAVIKHLEYKWKYSFLATDNRTNNPNILTAVVPLRNVSEWVDIKNSLKNSPFIKNVTVKEFTSTRAIVDVEYDGKESDLPILFAEQNLDLSRDTGTWVIIKLNQ